MKSLKRYLAGLIAVAAISGTSVSCSGKDGSSSENNVSYQSEDDFSVSADESEIKGVNDVDISGQTIYWLADYDINPNNNERSAALSIFEDVYGGKVEYIQTDANSKLTTLSQRLLSGEPVDMTTFEWESVPDGVSRKQYQPLDPYYDILEMDTDLWSDMTGVIDMFEYKDAHYVIPYQISEPLLITYSRKMMEAEGLKDPYELYEKGEWNWNVMMDMMNSFVSNAPEGNTRYGINGWFGQAMLQSSGHPVVTYENGVFKNNINDPEIEQAELMMQEMAQKQLYRPDWVGYFPEDQSTLFFAMSSWALGESNAKNPDADLMIVPFPKSPNADKNYICCNYAAKMLVDKSDKGEAVATYIKCERIAAANQDYKEAAKQKALEVEKTASGAVKSLVTEEQYNALQSYLDTNNVTPTFDFGYGMGEKMYGSGEYTYETRGVMNNLEQALLEGSAAVDSWTALRDAMSGIIEEQVKYFNAQ